MKARIALISALLSVLCGFASAAERAWKVIAGYEFYFPGDAGSGLKNQLAFVSQDIIASGYDSSSYSIDTKGGTGARAGILCPFADRVMLGATLGYILGPTMNANLTAASTVFGNGGMTVSRAVSFVRLMPDVRLNLANAGNWGFDLDSGWGAGFGEVSQSCTASGSVSCPFASTTKTWVGFAWEVSPVITWKLKNATLTLAPRYAGFPKFKGNDQIPPIDWQTFGVFLGAAF